MDEFKNHAEHRIILLVADGASMNLAGIIFEKIIFDEVLSIEIISQDFLAPYEKKIRPQFDMIEAMVITARPELHDDLNIIDINHPKNNQPFYANINRKGGKKRKGFRK